MTTEWAALREERLRNPEARAGYRTAALAFEIGKQVRELRLSRGITQAQLAAIIGTSQPAIARLEAGGAEPRLSTLAAISHALDAELTVSVA